MLKLKSKKHTHTNKQITGKRHCNKDEQAMTDKNYINDGEKE